MNKELDGALTELCDAFNRYGVKYVVGGFAVIMHGLARMTEDIYFLFMIYKNCSQDNYTQK